MKSNNQQQQANKAALKTVSKALSQKSHSTGPKVEGVRKGPWVIVTCSCELLINVGKISTSQSWGGGAEGKLPLPFYNLHCGAGGRGEHGGIECNY